MFLLKPGVSFILVLKLGLEVQATFVSTIFALDDRKAAF